jgi:hypothetical protein
VAFDRGLFRGQTHHQSHLIAGWLYEAVTGLTPRKTDFRWLCQEILKQQKPVTDADIEAFWQKPGA